ncbi:MAG: hypothetical protein KDD70_10125 [Bdellovibrionales bacterium]|nr:hypothetical protein [Bdellovibrionales bacterium]
MESRTDHIRIYPCFEASDASAKGYCQRYLETRHENLKFLRDTHSDEPFTKPWFLRTLDRIRQADIVLCLLGEKTWLASNVRWELIVAFALKKRVVTMRLHSNRMHVPPFLLVEHDAKIEQFNLEKLSSKLFHQEEQRAA